MLFMCGGVRVLTRMGISIVPIRLHSFSFSFIIKNIYHFEARASMLLY